MTIKRAFDVTASLLGLLFLTPVLAVIACLIKIEDGGPVLYRGQRVGLNGSTFQINKFRTMILRADKMGPSSTSEDDPRITKIGRILRLYKLDEFPQLFNVLKGDMSIVGPRPQVVWAVERYTCEEKEILSIRPGITDLASLHFPDEGRILKGAADPDAAYFELIHPRKMQLSLEYVRTQGFLLDLKIILKTVAAITKH